MPTTTAASPLKLAMFESSVAETPRGRTGGLPQPGAGFRRLSPTPELLAELEAASNRLEKATPEEIIAWGVEHYIATTIIFWESDKIAYAFTSSHDGT